MANKNVVVIAGGYSVKEMGVDFDLLSDIGYVIGVNDSIFYAMCNCGVSMDRLWMDNRLPEALELRIPLFLRRSAYRVNHKDALKDDTDIRLFECDNECRTMSTAHGTLNGFNSGVCAINLALQMQPEYIYLFGFDMTKSNTPQPYWYPSYDWPEAKKDGNTSEKRYQEWAGRFDYIQEHAQRNSVSILNVNPNSAIESFKKISYSDLKWWVS